MEQMHVAQQQQQYVFFLIRGIPVPMNQSVVSLFSLQNKGSEGTPSEPSRIPQGRTANPKKDPKKCFSETICGPVCLGLCLPPDEDKRGKQPGMKSGRTTGSQKCTSKNKKRKKEEEEEDKLLDALIRVNDEEASLPVFPAREQQQPRAISSLSRGPTHAQEISLTGSASSPPPKREQPRWSTTV